MVKTFDIILDLEKELYSPSSLLFSVSRSDFNSIKLNFGITQDEAPFDLTNKTIELAVKKPSGMVTYQDCEITSEIEGKATVLLNLQTYDEYGIYTAEVYIKDTDYLAVTSPFWYQSKTAIMTNEITLNIEEIISKLLSGLNSWSGTQAQYDAIVTKDAKTLYFITG